MRLEHVSGPAQEPVSVVEAEDHIRVDGPWESTQVAGWISAARRVCERHLNRVLVSQTWRLRLDRFPASGEIEISKRPLQSVTSITYVDPDGEVQTLSADVYDVDTSGVTGRVYLAFDESWPDVRLQRNAVTVEFVAGYGDPADVPQDFRSWILLTVGSLYANREGTVVGTITSRVRELDMLVAGDRVGL